MYASLAWDKMQPANLKMNVLCMRMNKLAFEIDENFKVRDLFKFNDGI